jgi:hypothetical protein
MESWLVCLIIISAILGLVIFPARVIRNLALIWRIPVTRISTIPGQGWIQVSGKVKGEPIQSWLNHAQCVFWNLDVKEFRSVGKGGSSWVTVHKESSGFFEVDDLTSRIKVQPLNCDFVLNHETVLENLDDSIMTKLEILGIKTKGFLGISRRLSIHMRSLTQGEEIWILGKFRKDPQVLSFSGGYIEPYMISNLGRGEMLKKYFRRNWISLVIPLLSYLVLAILYLFLLMLINNIL